MPEFKNKEEYAKWKTERVKEIEENPDRIRANTEPKSNHQTAKESLIQESLAKTKRMLYNCLVAYERRSSKKEARQQTALQELKKRNRKIQCPSCHSDVSINAIACPKCGQPITDSVRLDEVTRISRNQSIIAAVVIGFILLVWLIHSLPEPKPESEQERQAEIERDVKREQKLNEELRKDIERKDIERKLEAIKPVLEKACAEGDDRACSQLRKY